MARRKCSSYSQSTNLFPDCYWSKMFVGGNEEDGSKMGFCLLGSGLVRVLIRKLDPSNPEGYACVLG